MNSSIRKFVFAASLAGLFVVAPALKADPTYNLDLTNVGDQANAFGVYVGPYYGTINGGPTVAIICDDPAHDSFIGETWTATATNLGTGSLANTLYGASAASNYDEAAYLAYQLLLAPTNQTSQIEYQFAIWYLLNPSAFTGATPAISGLSATDLASLTNFINSNQGTLTAAQLDGFTIYTPVTGTGVCGSTACNPATPQEFLVYTPPISAPEPSTLLMLGLGLGSLGFVAFRRKKAEGSLIAA